MKELPAEVLQKIFVHLHQRDKVVCMSVCSSWKHAIENYVLFDTVCLYSKQQFNDFISKNRREPNQCEKIRRLIIDMKDMESNQMDILPLVILDLQELHFHETVEEHDLTFTKILSPHTWSKNIKIIIEKSSNIFTTHILKGGLCPALTEIEVHGADAQLGNEFVKLLVSAPALTSLSITKCNLSLEDLELLHTNSPMLSSFSMYNGDVNCATLPTNIQPASCMTKLTIRKTYVATTLTYINLQNYLAIKYPEISNMSYNVIVHNNADVEFNMKTGLALQIKQIAPHLESLKIDYDRHFQYIIPVLDNNGCQIKEFSMGTSTEASEVNLLVQSTQARYIQTLSLTHISSDNFIKYIGTFPVLTELHLYFTAPSPFNNRITIDINKLLEVVGNSLKTLRLSQANIEFNQMPESQYPSLRVLTLEETTVPNHVDLYISQSFPKLRKLVINFIDWEESTLYLGDLSLAYFELRDLISSDKAYVLVITTSNGNKRWYTAKPISDHRKSALTDPTTFPAMESLPFDKYKGLPYMTFICHSIYDFSLVNLG